MKKIFTSLLLLTAMAVTANAETKEVWTGPHYINNWQGIDLQASVFSSLKYGDKIIFSVTRDVEGATKVNQTYYQLQVRSWNNGVPTDITEGTDAVTNIEEDGDVTITLSDTQVDAIKTNGFSVNGHFVIVNSISIDTKAGVTTVLWEGNVATGSDWSGYVNLSSNNKAELANAKIGDDITVTFTTDADADYANIQIGNPNTWKAYDENAEGSPSVTASQQTFSYNIPDVATLETIQRDGILVRGGNITITKVELTTYDDSYDITSVTISEGIATYSNSYKALDFTNSGVKAYYASNVEKGKVTLTPISIVPAYTGIIVKGDADTYEIPVATGDIPAIEGTNYLKAVGDWDGKITASTDEIYHYSFTETAAPTFSLVTQETEIPAHKAYLETPTDITPETGSIKLVFTDDTSTGINEIETEVQESGDNSYYNLQGMRVEHPTKGIYIHKGKKIIIR